MTLKEIEQLAVKFRKLMDKSDRSGWGEQFHNFPHGTCGAVAEMFGTYLHDKCAVNVKYVASWHGSDWAKFGSHAWLEVDGWIIDLTCDQFPDIPISAPYIGRNRTWHSRWAVHTAVYMDQRLRYNRDRMFMCWGAAFDDLLEKLE
jgi:hypothetical protein